jgi:hypothetical protein
MGDKGTGDIVKKKGEDMRKERGSSRTRSEATYMAVEPALDQEAIARLAYHYWEARGCQDDSPDEDWFRAEAELRNRHAAAATG